MTRDSDPSPPNPSARRPRIIPLDDPSVAISESQPIAIDPSAAQPPPPASSAPRARIDLERSFRWGAILFSALGTAMSLAASLWIYRFVSVGFDRDDWIGWTLKGLIAVAVFAFAMILLREIIGFSKLSRLNRLRTDITAAIAAPNLKSEKQACDRLRQLYTNRPDLAWRLKNFDAHAGDIRDPGQRFALADREILSDIDGAVRRQITGSAKRVATVTALAPMMLIAVGFVLIENMRMLRRIATLYGGRPGIVGLFRLTRMVVTHLVATGGVALTDDLLGQFIGQDLVRRLSARLGEGAFNGALTARVGVAALDLIRPLPFVEARPIRVRDIVAELFNRGTPEAKS
jgi:putative membrane protein